jgi:hypothetical protein
MRILLFISLFIIHFVSFAQQKVEQPTKPKIKVQKKDKTGTILYFFEKSGGVAINTNGWSAFYNKAKIVHFTKKKYWEIEYSKIKHPKETKSNSLYTQGADVNPRSFVFGKKNSLFAISFKEGVNYKLSQKSIRKGVETSVNASAGVTLGLLKPYYLILIYNNQIDSTTRKDEYRYERYSADNAAVFQDYFTIYGYGGFLKGLFQTKPIIGMNAQLGLCFDYSNYDENISSLEIGIKASAFASNVPIMIGASNHQVFPALYASYRIGKRK